MYVNLIETKKEKTLGLFFFCFFIFQLRMQLKLLFFPTFVETALLVV